MEGGQQSPWPFRIGIPYDDSRNFEGFWGPKTVTLNFCEEVCSLLWCCGGVVAASRLAFRDSQVDMRGCGHGGYLWLTLAKDYVVSYYIAEVCNVSTMTSTPAVLAMRH